MPREQLRRAGRVTWPPGHSAAGALPAAPSGDNCRKPHAPQAVGLLPPEPVANFLAVLGTHSTRQKPLPFTGLRDAPQASCQPPRGARGRPRLPARLACRVSSGTAAPVGRPANAPQPATPGRQAQTASHCFLARDSLTGGLARFRRTAWAVVSQRYGISCSPVSPRKSSSPCRPRCKAMRSRRMKGLRRPDGRGPQGRRPEKRHAGFPRQIGMSLVLSSFCGWQR
jgi:hypothetical protein